MLFPPDEFYKIGKFQKILQDLHSSTELEDSNCGPVKWDLPIARIFNNKTNTALFRKIYLS